MRLDYGVGGQWLWITSDTTNGEFAQWMNPGDGFESGATTWSGLDTVDATSHDMAFGLFGGPCTGPTDEVCTGGVDEDFNGLIDCGDFPCFADAVCYEGPYAETDDDGNNAVQWTWGSTSIVISEGPGTAEDIGLTLEAGTSYLITGSAEDNGEAPTFDNDDHDTYAFNSGDATDALIMLDLEGTGNDLDVIITDTGVTDAVGPGQIANGSSDTLDGIWEEYWSIGGQGGALTPDTDYYISVGAYAQAGTEYPADYELYIVAY
jgi:hypothetical protein